MPDREKVIKGLETCSDVYYGADGACSSCPYSQTNGDRCLAELVHDAIAMLNEQPEIVRCKDCKHWDSEEHDCNIKIGWFACGADWFCADGERRDDDA